jgi:hypothetical protein
MLRKVLFTVLSLFADPLWRVSRAYPTLAMERSRFAVRVSVFLGRSTWFDRFDDQRVWIGEIRFILLG